MKSTSFDQGIFVLGTFICVPTSFHLKHALHALHTTMRQDFTRNLARYLTSICQTNKRTNIRLSERDWSVHGDIYIHWDDHQTPSVF